MTDMTSSTLNDSLLGKRGRDPSSLNEPEGSTKTSTLSFSSSSLSSDPSSSDSFKEKGCSMRETGGALLPLDKDDLQIPPAKRARLERKKMLKKRPLQPNLICIVCETLFQGPHLPRSVPLLIQEMESFLSFLSSSSSSPSNEDHQPPAKEKPQTPREGVCVSHRAEGLLIHLLRETRGQNLSLSDPAPPTCPSHPSEPQDKFCSDCNKVVCGTCGTSYFHISHTVRPLDEVLDRKKKGLLETIRTLDTKISLFLNSLHRFSCLPEKNELAKQAQKEALSIFFQNLIKDHSEDKDILIAIQNDLLRTVALQNCESYKWYVGALGPTVKLKENFKVVQEFVQKIFTLQNSYFLIKAISLVDGVLHSVGKERIVDDFEKTLEGYARTVSGPLFLDLRVFKRGRAPSFMKEALISLSDEDLLKIFGVSSRKILHWYIHKYIDQDIDKKPSNTH